MKDGAHTHSHGDPPVGLASAILVVAGAVIAASVLERVLMAVLICAAVAAGLLVIGLVSYVVAACRRYQQYTAWLEGASYYAATPSTASPGLAAADPLVLRHALTDLLTPLLADRAVLPAGDSDRHKHLHLHGLTPDQAAAILTALDARHHAPPGPDGGSQ